MKWNGRGPGEMSWKWKVMEVMEGFSWHIVVQRWHREIAVTGTLVSHQALRDKWLNFLAQEGGGLTEKIPHLFFHHPTWLSSLSKHNENKADQLSSSSASTNQWSSLLPEPQARPLLDHSHHIPHDSTICIRHVLQYYHDDHSYFGCQKTWNQ